MPPNRATRRASRSKQAWEKYMAIHKVNKDGESKASVARSLDVPESTLRGWCKNLEKIIAMAKQNPPQEKSDYIAFTKALEAAKLLAPGEELLPNAGNAPQNLSVNNISPIQTEDEEEALDLSRTSPLNNKVEPPVAENPISSMATFWETARFLQVFQQAQMSILSENGIPVSNLPRNHSSNMPSGRLPTQVSPNSSGATLSSPRNVQRRPSPVQGLTPEQQQPNLHFMDVYRNVIGSMVPVPLVNHEMMQNNRVAPASYSVSQNQAFNGVPAIQSTYFPSINSNNNQVQKLESPITAPNQPTPAATILPSFYSKNSGQSYPGTSAPYLNGYPSSQNKNQLLYHNGSNRDDMSDTSCSTLDLSMKTGSFKNDTESEVEEMESDKTEEEVVEAKPLIAKVEPEPQFEEPPLLIAKPVQEEPKTEIKEEDIKQKADQKGRRTSRKRSLASVVRNLNFEGEQQEPRKHRKIEDCIHYGETFLEILKENAENQRYTAFQLKTVQAILSVVKEDINARQN